MSQENQEYDLVDIYKRNKFLKKENGEDVWFSIENYIDRKYFEIPFAIITAWNPMIEKCSGDDNIAMNSQLEAKIKSLKYAYEHTIGKCDGHSEDSFIIYRINKREAIQLGNDFKQYSIFYNARHSLEYIECENETILLKNDISRRNEDCSYTPVYSSISEDSSVSEVITILKEKNYICPNSERWNFLWRNILANTTIERPSSSNATNEEKQKRFFEHLKYADYKEKLPVVIRFLNKTETTQWHIALTDEE